jgi:ribonucleoside-diphosphate reductase alpha chain
MDGYELPELNHDMVVALKRQNRVYSKELIDEVARVGTIQTVAGIPEKLKEVFVTAMDIPIEAHVKMQAVFQKHTDNAVSKTINMPAEASVEDVLGAWTLAWKLKCKGMTVYRDRSRSEQVLHVGSRGAKKTTGVVAPKHQDASEDMCPQCEGRLSRQEGCMSCPSCGYSRCSL